MSRSPDFPMNRRPRAFPFLLLLTGLFGGLLTGCEVIDGGPGDPDAPSVLLTVPPGASLGTVADSLHGRGLVERPGLFRIYARLRRVDRNIQAGTYAFQPGAAWNSLLSDLLTGRVLTVPMTIPEGFSLQRMAPRIAEASGVPTDSVLTLLTDPEAPDLFELTVPGPGFEGYLFPDTYRFAPETPLDRVVRVMVQRYRQAWTPRRRARLAELGMTERQAVTLASIIQAEARVVAEMPRISAVYHNRLRLGWPLQADPTVLYALGGHRERLLYAAMDSVADHPYNTYANPGLPPGPIGAPGEAALEAALHPEDVDLMFFVARADGSHVFSRTLAEHNRAVAAARRERTPN